MNTADNVATLPWGGHAGASLSLEGVSETRAPVVLHSDVAPGHKIALSDIALAQAVVKYGAPIGRASAVIPAGALVHVHNLKSRFSPVSREGAQDGTAMTVVKAVPLEHLLTLALKSAGADNAAAIDAARHIVSAELKGVVTHGLRRMPALIARLQSGAINGAATPTQERRGVVVSLDGCAGLGQHVARVAADAAIEVAREQGAGIALVRNSSHFGYAGHYAAHIAEAGMIGLAISNGQVLVGPPGATQAIFSNDPFALAAPIGEDSVFEFDMATSVTSRARIAMAAELGEAIAPGLALDRNGAPTTNAAAALAGLLLPLGGAKGFGFIAALEVLSGVLPGGAYADLVSSKETAPDRAEGTGHFLMAIAPPKDAGSEGFRARMADLQRKVESLPMAEGHAAARLPGPRRAALAQERLHKGIPLTPDIAQMLQEMSARLGVDIAITQGHAE